MTEFPSCFLSDVEATIVGTAESSNYAGQYPASKLIDGLGINGLWGSNGCAHTTGDSDWFSLELESPKKITRVQIANRVDCCLERGQNVRISIGPSKVYDPNEPLCLPQISQLNTQPGLKDYVCRGDLHDGKFVKISRAGRLNLCEVKIFTGQGKVMSLSVAKKFPTSHFPFPRCLL